MKSQILFCLFTFFYSWNSLAQSGMEYYLPEMEYDTSIPTPKEVLGFDIGDWHVSHDQLLKYMHAIDAASDKVEIIEYARSHEQRPLILMKISTPENLSNQEEIRKKHLQLTDPNESDKVDINALPAILLQGYSIHGNESSGANAAIVNAYYLVAGKGAEVQEKLNNTLILLDPCYNPDGLNRFASWANTHKGVNLVSDPASRELNEVWPRGRTNHYWFDLNRDWLLLTHPESQGRIKMFHHWTPNVLTDHHEMGTNSTFFFQPGIPSRTNPNTPQRNQDITEKIGTYHAAALDSIGSLYYTKASFDDYYYGKGSTYPDANGCIGILFEQASSRGHLQESVNGLLSFPFTIRNQFVTSLSTQKATSEMRKELLEWKRNFYKKQQKSANSSRVKGYVFQDFDRNKVNRFLKILDSHKVDAYQLDQDIQKNGLNYKKGNGYYVPLDQRQYLMAKTIFESVNTFPDSIFYDVSAWTLPLAFDLNYAEVSSKIKKGKKASHNSKTGSLIKGKNAYAFILDWDNYEAPAALYQIQNDELRSKVINAPFSVMTGAGLKRFERGDVMIPIQNQKKTRTELEAYLDKIARKYGVDIHTITTGWADNNMTLGNPQVEGLDQPKIAMIVGEGVNSYDAGEVWHQMDQRYGIPLSMIDKRQIFRAQFNRYNTLILAHGRYSDLSDSEKDKITKWVKAGGTLIVFRSAISWAVKNGLVNLDVAKEKENSTGKSNYKESNRARGAQALGGAIFHANMDLTHPLCYGYSDDHIALFRRGTTFYDPVQNDYSMPVRYSKSPVASGYTPRGIPEKASSKPAVTVHRSGSGLTICFQDNLLFRGYWYGGSKMFANALFFSKAIDSYTAARE